MKLVEAESTGPVEGEEAIITPPRPPHRRVSVSLLLTLSVLIGTVLAIYWVFPARHNLLVTEAIEHHRNPPAWDLAAPSTSEAHAWALGIAGMDVPLPAADAKIVGTKRLELFDRGAALMRVQIGGDEVTYLVQHTRGVPPERAERVEGDLMAIAWRTGKFTCVAVGPEQDAAKWRKAIGAP
jgi:hypothetical protein